MGRGGHRYPIEHAEGRELDFASLLWEALFSHKSQQGAQFRSELDDIYLRWRRLVGVLNSYRTSSWKGPSSDLQHLVDSLKSLTVPTRVVYPRPHSTPEIEAEIAWRFDASIRKQLIDNSRRAIRYVFNISKIMNCGKNLVRFFAQ